MRMGRKLATAVALGTALVYLSSAGAQDTPSVKECMKCQNTVRVELSKMAKTKNKIDWEAAAEKSKEWVAAAEAMGKNDPPIGTKESWKMQTEKYLTNVKAVDGAIAKKDLGSLTKSLATFGASCGGCHGKHKPK